MVPLLSSIVPSSVQLFWSGTACFVAGKSAYTTIDGLVNFKGCYVNFKDYFLNFEDYFVNKKGYKTTTIKNL